MKEFNAMFSSKPYQGILFDFDGVLVQSMEDNFKAWQAATAEYGLTINEEDYLPLEGMPVKDVVIKLFGIYGRPVPDAKKIAGLKDDYYLQFHQLGVFFHLQF